MLTLYLIRHAKSSWNDPTIADFDRPLNERGLLNAPFMGKILLAKKDIPELIVTSNAKRAYSTAKRIAAELNYAKDKIIRVEELYHANIKTWLKTVNAFDSTEAKSIMCFGHNNGITEFLNYLTDGEIQNMPTCGIAKIKFNFSEWKMVSKGTGELIYFDYPKRYTDPPN